MVGIFNDSFPPILDGVATTAQNYAYWLQQKGVDTCVVTPHAPSALDDYPYPVYRFHSMPIPMRKPYRLGMARVDYQFRHFLRKQPFELVHAHCPFATGWLAKNIAKHQHIPLVATFHSKFKQDFERAVPFGPIVNQALDTVVNFFEQADEVWIPQASVEDTLREYGYTGRIEVVENGNDFVTSNEEVDLMRAEMRAELGLQAHECMLLFVGQLIWEKNIELVLNAVAQNKQKPCRLYLVGVGYAASGIRKKLAELGIEDKVVMPGCILDRQLLQRYYAAADLFLFPSIYDTFGIVVREAAAMHTPAVLLGGTDAANAVRPDVNGFVSAPNREAYIDMLSWLIEHPEKCKQVGDQAATSLTRSWEQVADEVIMRYADLKARYAAEHR